MVQFFLMARYYRLLESKLAQLKKHRSGEAQPRNCEHNACMMVSERVPTGPILDSAPPSYVAWTA